MSRSFPAHFYVAFLLALVPLGTVAAHEGSHGNEVMWKVCGAKQINDGCSFQNSAGDVSRGSCQSMADHLVCVRNQPVERATGPAQAAQLEGHEQADKRIIWPIVIALLLALGIIYSVVRWLGIKSGEGNGDD